MNRSFRGIFSLNSIFHGFIGGVLLFIRCIEGWIVAVFILGIFLGDLKMQLLWFLDWVRDKINNVEMIFLTEEMLRCQLRM